MAATTPDPLTYVYDFPGALDAFQRHRAALLACQKVRINFVLPRAMRPCFCISSRRRSHFCHRVNRPALGASKYLEPRITMQVKREARPLRPKGKHAAPCLVVRAWVAGQKARLLPCDTGIAIEKLSSVKQVERPLAVFLACVVGSVGWRA